MTTSYNTLRLNLRISEYSAEGETHLTGFNAVAVPAVFTFAVLLTLAAKTNALSKNAVLTDISGMKTDCVSQIWLV